MTARSRLMLGASVLVLSAGALSACGAGASSTVSSPGAVASAPAREAGLYKSTNLCVENRTTDLLDIEFSDFDTRQTDVASVAPGMTVCAEGTFIGGPDVSGTIAVPGAATKVRFTAVNPSVGAPSASLLAEDGRSYGVCYQSLFDENADAFVEADDGVLNYRIARLPDTAWKQVLIAVGPTNGRSWNDKACTGGRVPRL